MMTRKEKELRLKQLNGLIKEQENWIADQHKRIGFVKEQLESYKQQQSTLTASLNKIAPEPVVSDHAILRYLERKFKFDVNGIRNEILTDERKGAIKAGAIKIKVDGIDFVVKNGVIVTSI